MAPKVKWDKVVKYVDFGHNCFVLGTWLYMEMLMMFTFYTHVNRGFGFDFSTVGSFDLWSEVAVDFKFVVVFNALNLLFMADRKTKMSTFLTALYHHVKAVLIYFVTYKVLSGAHNLRWSLINQVVFVQLALLESGYKFNQFMDHKSEFLEWLYHKVFLLLYPLLCISEFTLMSSSFQHLKNFNQYKSFPSSMPNRFNFSINLHLLYKFLPAPLALASTVVYFKRFKTT